MDSKTHVFFAEALLKFTGQPIELSAVSLFPQIDRQPSVLHRLFAHNVFRANELVEKGIQVVYHEYPNQSDDYTMTRFHEDRKRILHYLVDFKLNSEDYWQSHRNAALMSFITHLYLDTFNQPTQCFAPYSVYCSGQWEMWKKIGDFRSRLYLSDRINQLRNDLIKQLPEAEGPTCEQWTFAMLLRMCEASEGKVPLEIAHAAMDKLFMRIEKGPQLNNSIDWLVQFEETVSKLHEKHLE